MARCFEYGKKEVAYLKNHDKNAQAAHSMSPPAQLPCDAIPFR